MPSMGFRDSDSQTDKAPEAKETASLRSCVALPRMLHAKLSCTQLFVSWMLSCFRPVNRRKANSSSVAIALVPEPPPNTPMDIASNLGNLEVSNTAADSAAVYCYRHTGHVRKCAGSCTCQHAGCVLHSLQPSWVVTAFVSSVHMFMAA